MRYKKQQNINFDDYISPRELVMFHWRDGVQEITRGKNIDQLNERENERLEEYIAKKKKQLLCMHSKQKGREYEPGFKKLVPLRTKIGSHYLYKREDVDNWVKQYCKDNED